MAVGGNRITRNALKKMPEGATLWDSELKGFGARRQKDAVSFFVKCRFKGRQRWVTIGRMGNPWTLDTARTAAMRLLVGITEGVDPRRPNIKGVTLKEGLERFLEEHGGKLKESTRYEYERLCKADIIPKLGKLRLDEDLRPELGKFHSDMAKTPRMANLALMVLSSFMRWAEENGLRPEGKNPCAGIAKYRETKRERYLSAAELKALGKVLAKREADGSENAFVVAALRLLILTGARLNEILTLKWVHVDEARGRLRLPDSKTGAKVIRLSNAALQVLTAVPRVDKNPFVIVGDRKGGHLVNLQKPWQRIRKEAKLEDVRLHDLRHSYASMAAEAGASLPMIGKLLGHNQTQTTGRYAHLTEASVDRLNEEIGEQMMGVLGGGIATGGGASGQEAGVKRAESKQRELK